MNRRHFVGVVSAAAAGIAAGLGLSKGRAIEGAVAPIGKGIRERWEAVPNPEWVAAKYEVQFYVLNKETGEMNCYHVGNSSEGPYPPVRGNHINKNGELIPLSPWILKTIPL